MIQFHGTGTQHKNGAGTTGTEHKNGAGTLTFPPFPRPGHFNACVDI